jgi:hypothetical protein
VIGCAFLGYDYWMNEEVNWLFAGIFFGIVPILGAFAIFVPILWRRRASRAGQEVVIGRGGLVMNGALQTWSGPFDQLADIAFQEGPDGAALVFSIRSLSRGSVTGYITREVVVPVPLGEQAAAQRVVEALGVG